MKLRSYQSFNRLFFSWLPTELASFSSAAGFSSIISGIASPAVFLTLDSDLASIFSAALSVSRNSSGFSMVSQSSGSTSGFITFSFFLPGSSLFADLSAAATSDEAWVSRGSEDVLPSITGGVSLAVSGCGRSSAVGGKTFLLDVSALFEYRSQVVSRARCKLRYQFLISPLILGLKATEHYSFQFLILLFLLFHQPFSHHT